MLIWPSQSNCMLSWKSDPSLRGSSEATVNMVSATPPQPFMATAFSSQEDMMGILIQALRQEIQKASPQTRQNFSNSRSSSTNGRSVRFKSPERNRQSANTNQNQNYRNSNNGNWYNNNQNNRYNNSGDQQNNSYNNIRSTSNKQQNRNNTKPTTM